MRDDETALHIIRHISSCFDEHYRSFNDSLLQIFMQNGALEAGLYALCARSDAREIGFCALTAACIGRLKPEWQDPVRRSVCDRIASELRSRIGRADGAVDRVRDCLRAARTRTGEVAPHEAIALHVIGVFEPAHLTDAGTPLRRPDQVRPLSDLLFSVGSDWIRAFVRHQPASPVPVHAAS